MEPTSVELWTLQDWLAYADQFTDGRFLAMRCMTVLAAKVREQDNQIREMRSDIEGLRSIIGRAGLP